MIWRCRPRKSGMLGNHSTQPGSSSPLTWSAWLIAHIWISPKDLSSLAGARMFGQSALKRKTSRPGD